MNEQYMDTYLEAKPLFDFIFREGEIIEIRGRPAPITAGLYSSIELAARSAAIRSIREHKNVGFTINPVSTASFHYSKNAHQLNAINRYARYTVKNEDVSCRRTYLIDIDPVRPSNMASTDAEKAAAFAVTLAVKAFLTGQDWPEPILVDSGNGFYLLYRGDDGDAEGDVLKFTLRFLANKFNTEAVEIDTGVYVAGQTARVPGTWNRKGEDTPERPHRMAKVLAYPVKFEPVRAGLIYGLGVRGGYKPPYNGPPGKSKRELLLDADGMLELIEEFPEHLCLRNIREESDRTFFDLSECPFVGRQHSNDNGRKTSIILYPDGVGFHCFSSGCEGKTFRMLIEFLEEETGRTPSMDIWEDEEDSEEADAEHLERAWRWLCKDWIGREVMNGNVLSGAAESDEDESDDPDVDDSTESDVDDSTESDGCESDDSDVDVYTPPETLTEVIDLGGGWTLCPDPYVSPRLRHALSDPVPDLGDLTYDDLVGPFLAIAFAEYERLSQGSRPDRAADFRRDIDEVIDYSNIGAMARYIGSEMIEDMHYWCHPSPETDFRFAARVRAEKDASRWMHRSAPKQIIPLTFEEMLPAVQQKALAVDATITNYYGKETHRSLIEQAIRTRNLADMARFLGPETLRELADLCAI